MRPAQDVDDADALLLRELDLGFEAIERRAGDALVCHAGCSECCHGPFPVTALDVRRLRRGLTDLKDNDPSAAERIVERAHRAVETLSSGYPGEVGNGRLTADVETLDRFFEGHSDLPCPVLDPATGRCELYESRPVACRTYGPPLRFDRRDVPPCRLCFNEAPPEVVEACRFTPDADGRERALLDILGVPDGDEWETLIAFGVLHHSRDQGIQSPPPATRSLPFDPVPYDPGPALTPIEPRKT